MTEKKKLTPQERARKFAEEYQKLCNSLGCQHAYAPVYTPEGRTLVQVQVQVNDEQKGI